MAKGKNTPIKKTETTDLSKTNPKNENKSQEKVPVNFDVSSLETEENPVFRKFVYPIILLVSLFIVFGNSLKFEFTSCDDVDLIVDNYPFIKKLKNIPQAFKQSCFEIPGHITEDKAYYRPILISSFIVDAQRSQPTFDGYPTPKAFYFTNIILHFLCCYILFQILLLLGIESFFAFLLTMIFAYHPLNVMAVSWVPGRNDSLLGIFVGIYIYQMLKFSVNRAPERAIFVVLAFLAALFTKESGLMLFPLGIILLWALGKDWKKVVLSPIYLGGSIVSIGLWWFARMKAMEGDKIEPTFSENVLTFFQNLKYIPTHIGKYFFPFSLSVMPGVTTQSTILGIIAILVLGFLFLNLRPIKLGIFAVLWIGFFLAPTLIVPKLPAYEHRNYIPLMGVMLVIPFLKFWKNKEGIRIPLLFNSRESYGMIGLICLFALRSFLHTDTFSNRWNFWENATHDSPFEGSAWVNLGKLKEETGDNVAAKEYYWKALQFDSTTLKANNNYGAMCFVVDNNKVEGLKYFKRETIFHPENTDAINNIGITYRNKGDLDSAIYYFKKCVKINPVHVNALSTLQDLYMAKNDIPNAAYYGQKVKEIRDKQSAILNR